MIPVQSQVATCEDAICRATGECRGYPWRCHRTLAQVDQQQAEIPAELRERLPASEIGT